MPGSDILLALANAMNTSPDEFFQIAGSINKISEAKAPYIVNPQMSRIIDAATQLNDTNVDLLADFSELLLHREEAESGDDDGVPESIPG